MNPVTTSPPHPLTPWAEALAAYGLLREGAAALPASDEPFYLWPEHLPAYNLWCAAQTQWRHGFNGPTGLDYAGVRAHMAGRVARRHQARRLAELQCMERAALEAWGEMREARR